MQVPKPSSALSKLRAAATKVVELPALTRDLRDAGDIGPADRVLVKIRRVRAGEVVSETGTTPLLFSLARDRKKGESNAEFAERIQEKLQDDPEALRESQRQHLVTTEAIVKLGVTAIAIAPEGSEPEWEPLTIGEGEATSDILGNDYATVHDAIVLFGSLKYAALGGAGVEAFPAERPGAGGEQGVSGVQQDADGVPEPADS